MLVKIRSPKQTKNTAYQYDFGKTIQKRTRTEGIIIITTTLGIDRAKEVGAHRDCLGNLDEGCGEARGRTHHLPNLGHPATEAVAGTFLCPKMRERTNKQELAHGQ